MELRVEKLTLPEVIEFNFSELKQKITEKTSSYVGLIYSEDQMKQAKTDCAMLRKFTKALSDERIRVKKEVLKPYEDFEAKISELSGIVNEAINNIDSQVKAADEKRKAEKLEKIRELFKNAVYPDWVTLEMVMDARWLNSSVTMTSISKDLISKLEQIENDLSTLSRMPEFAFEAVEVYKTTLDINKAISEGARLSEMQKRKAEAEAKAAEARRIAEEQIIIEEAPIKHQLDPFPADAMNPPEPLAQWVSFKAFLTVDQAMDLKRYFDDNGIMFKSI